MNIANHDLGVPEHAAAADFIVLGQLLDRPEWNVKGSSLPFSENKVPDGIFKMRQSYHSAHYWDIFRTAQEKSGFSLSRSRITDTLYQGLRELLTQIRNATGDRKLPILKERLGPPCREIGAQLIS